jgi:hypothetical protein
MRAIVYKNIDAKAADKALQSGRMHWREWSKMITNLLQSIIDENVRSGFMHNDLHLENVVFDRDTYTLRTLDYGRVILDRVYMPKYTSNTDIIDAVEPYKGIIDIPDMKKGWRWSNFRTTTKADYKTVAEDLRWSTDIMKVCVMYYTSCVSSKPRRSLF